MTEYREYEKFLKSVDESELRRKIRRFRDMDFQNMSYEDVESEIINVLEYNNAFKLIPDIYTYPTGVYFYRVRKVEGFHVSDENLLNFVNLDMSDFWDRPPEKMDENGYGRLNKPKESLLYTAPIDALIAINETKKEIIGGNIFALIAYQSIEKIKVNIIGDYFYSAKFGITDEKTIRVGETYSDFLRVEFLNTVGKGTEYLYKISERIAKKYFDLGEIQDAWAYPSAKDKTKCNVCFRPEIAKGLFELRGAVIARHENQQVYCLAIAHGFDEKGNAIYHEIGSDVQKRYFPEIVSNKEEI